MFPPDMDINKGVELILKGDKKKPPKQTQSSSISNYPYLAGSLDYRWT